MRKYGYISGMFCLLTFLVIAAACSDDMPDAPSLYDPSAEADGFIGSTRYFEIREQTSDFPYEEFSLKIEAPDGSVITRCGSQKRVGGVSQFSLYNGLKDGTYRLLYLEYDRKLNHKLDALPERFKKAHYGLGGKVEVKDGKIVSIGHYDSAIGLCGTGTSDDPYVIASYDQMERLMLYVNSAETNHLVTSETYFRQVQPIDMDMASYDCDLRNGWYPIGNDTNLPFRGVFQGNTISNLWCDRGNSPGIGLFGYIYNATISGLNMEDCYMTGNYAVGNVAGAVIAGGDDHGKSTIANCSLIRCEVEGTAQSFAIGGVVGAVDVQGNVLIAGCSSEDGKVTGSYNVGGMLGGAAIRSTTVAADCVNSTPVTAEYSGAGGIVGACDTINVTACTNHAEIRGATKYSGADGTAGIGAGGIVGGTGMSALSSVINNGKVSGYDGVGGLLGSTRIRGDESSGYVYNTTIIRGGGNTGAISGHNSVGGAAGEGQFGCYGVYNAADISGNDYVGGIVGNTAISSPQNAINAGKVSGRNYVAGIVAKTSMGVVASSQNSGEVSASGHHSAGIVGLSGNNTIVHFCANSGKISGNGKVAGIIGEIGDPRQWSAANIADCVVGSLECVMAFLGPTMAVSGIALHGTSKVAAIGIHITEFLTEAVLTVADTALVSYGVYEILEAEAPEIEESIHTETESIRADIESRMREMRTKLSSGFKHDLYPSNSLQNYPGAIEAVKNYVEQKGNDEIFNDNLNLIRENRAEEEEHQKHSSEVVHEVIGGICIAVSVVAAVGGIVASGGTAAPFIVAGALSAAVGGVNAITKATGDFKVNSAVVSQCMNTGGISSLSAPVGGIAGEMQDGCLLEYCINAGDLPYNTDAFCGKYHSHAETRYSISAADPAGVDSPQMSHCNNVAMYWPFEMTDHLKTNNYELCGCYPFTKEMIGREASYHLGWADENTGVIYTLEIPVGSGKFFDIPDGMTDSFPVPNKSRAASDRLL